MKVLTSVVELRHVSAPKLVEVFSIPPFVYCFNGHAWSGGQVPFLMVVQGGKKRAPFTEHSWAVVTCYRLRGSCTSWEHEF
jgi:hypothetical protein